MVVVAGRLALVSVPATAAAPVAKQPSVQASTRVSDGHDLHFGSDTVQTGTAARHRRASYAWTGRKILYTETIPSKWDWSLSTAITKWNSSGGGITFVRAANPRKARVTISYGSIGSAAGLATVGRSRHGFVKLSSAYSSVDSLDARNRVQVMGIFTHELGHVLGFQHTSARCSLMSPVLDVDGCQVLPATQPGFYKCRTIDAPLVARFVQLYGGRAQYPGPMCPVDPLPSALSGVAFAGGQAAPVTVTWGKPAFAPAGSQVVVRSWTAPVCSAVPDVAATSYAPVAAGVWHGPEADVTGTACFSVRLVNRYGAGGPAVSRLMSF
jgi:hypothetical protein